MKIYKKNVMNIAIIITCIPTMLFLLWCNPVILIVGVLLLVGCCYSFIKRRTKFKDEYVYVSKIDMIIIVAIIVFVSFFSGVGGFFPQTGDNLARNPIFYDLIKLDWPVVYYQMNTGLTYYIGFFLLPALVAKIFGGSFLVGNIVLVLQVAVYLCVTSFLIICWLDTSKRIIHIFTPIILTVFTGINFIGEKIASIFGYEHQSASQELLSTIPGATYIGNFFAIRQTFNHIVPTILIVVIYVCM